jgi:pimeloyl-ACP methyl ester carboxylesterase
MPRMPDSEEWMNLIMEDVGKTGSEAAQALQAESFSFKLEVPENCPPVLVVIGEHDIAMACRDFDELHRRLWERNPQCEKLVLKGAWHNHPIEVPREFSGIILDWLLKILD